MKPSTAGMFYLTFLGILLVTCGPSEKTKKLIDDSKKIFGTIPDKNARWGGGHSRIDSVRRKVIF